MVLQPGSPGLRSTADRKVGLRMVAVVSHEERQGRSPHRRTKQFLSCIIVAWSGNPEISPLFPRDWQGTSPQDASPSCGLHPRINKLT